MTFTQAEYDQALAEIGPIQEARYQRAFAEAVMANLEQAIKLHAGYPYCSVSLTTPQLQEFEIIIKERLNKCLDLSIYNTQYKDFLSKLAVSLEVPEPGKLVIVPNEYFKLLYEGKAPVKFYQPTRKNLEDWWNHHKKTKTQIQIRKHWMGATVFESMETCKLIPPTLEAVKQYFRDTEKGIPYTEEDLSTVKVTYYSDADPRINWKEVYIVQIAGRVVAWTNGPVTK